MSGVISLSPWPRRQTLIYGRSPHFPILRMWPPVLLYAILCSYSLSCRTIVSLDYPLPGFMYLSVVRYLEGIFLPTSEFTSCTSTDEFYSELTANWEEGFDNVTVSKLDI